jgi:predicted CXXCH cytochrome family protein
MSPKPLAFLWLLAAVIALIATACQTTAVGPTALAVDGAPLGSVQREHQVMRSVFCSRCHPDIYAEHAMNTHGRAFTDPEVRLATGDFQHGDCIRCHTPRPVFETGIGKNPQRRFYDLEEGNTCMTCHWRQGIDYSRFVGGAECKQVFDPRVGTVEACASCHRNHGTPYQWEQAALGKQAGKVCIDCHMPKVERPVAVGGPVKRVRSHAFPGARSESQLHKAYAYDARVDGNEVVVRIENAGVGHNFPTELKQRSLESLVVVRDDSGKVIARSRMVFRDPYKRPYGMHLQVNTQIPSGESREHRVPIAAAAGSVECELHYKHYYPLEDNEPDLTRRLEQRRFAFAGVTPNLRPIDTEPEVKGHTPEGIDPRVASVADFVDFQKLPIGKTQVDVPTGNSAADIGKLIDLFMFPVPEANRAAQQRLVAIGAPAIPQLVKALGSWDSKTFNQATAVLSKIGAPAVSALRAALASDDLYERVHSRRLLELLPVPTDRAAFVAEVSAGLRLPNALDRTSAAALLGRLGDLDAVPTLTAMLGDRDPDVVLAAGQALAALGAREAIPALNAAMAAADFDETAIDLAFALCRLGSTDGVPMLLANLDHRDDLVRQECFEKFFLAVGVHQGYEPRSAPEERLAAIARLQAWWHQDGSLRALRSVYLPEPAIDNKAFAIVSGLGGGDGIAPAVANDQKAIDELVGMREDAQLALWRGMKFPPGFASKRASLLTALGRIRDPMAAPFLCQALRDPVLGVAAYAAQALETSGDRDCLPALGRYQARVLSLATGGRLPAGIQADPLLAQTARTRLLLGDGRARTDLVSMLFSDDEQARRLAIQTLQETSGGDARGYDPAAPAADRAKAATRWSD